MGAVSTDPRNSAWQIFDLEISVLFGGSKGHYSNVHDGAAAAVAAMQEVILEGLAVAIHSGLQHMRVHMNASRGLLNVTQQQLRPTSSAAVKCNDYYFLSYCFRRLLRVQSISSAAATPHFSPSAASAGGY